MPYLGYSKREMQSVQWSQGMTYTYIIPFPADDMIRTTYSLLCLPRTINILSQAARIAQYSSGMLIQVLP